MRTRADQSPESQAVQATVIGAADSKQVDLPRLAQQDGQVVADATKRGPPPPAEEKLPGWFKVLETRNISQDGYRTQLQAGKVLSDTSYDIGALKRQGVKLESLGEFSHADAPS